MPDRFEDVDPELFQQARDADKAGDTAHVNELLAKIAGEGPPPPPESEPPLPE